jgi:hypothetical protein
MTERKIGFVDLILPHYVSAVCCHVLNLENKRREFYFEHGQPADLRLHVFFTAPPGYMKTFILKRCLDRNNSLFGSGPVKTAFLGEMTTAGFVGTTDLVEGETVEHTGAAYDFQDHVLGIDEFSVITNMMQADHSKNLDNAMLTALDSGYIIKRLASGEIRYETHLTLFTGSQPARFNLTSGLGRRFDMIYFVPSRMQQDQMRQYRREGKGVMGLTETSKAVYHLTERMLDDIKIIRSITFHDSIYTMLDTLRVPHFEEPLYEKLALGLSLSTQPITADFIVQCTPEVKQLWTQEFDWRFKVKSGAQDSQVMQIITENPGIEEGLLKNLLLDFGMSYTETYMAVDSLHRQRRIGVVLDSKDQKSRKRFLWPYH